MDKAFDFVRSLCPSVFEVFGFPTVELHSDYCEVRFRTSSVIKMNDLQSFTLFDDFRIYASIDDKINVVFTFEY